MRCGIGGTAAPGVLNLAGGGGTRLAGGCESRTRRGGLGPTAPDKPAARANGTVRPSDMPITMSRTTSEPAKCSSGCGWLWWRISVMADQLGRGVYPPYPPRKKVLTRRSLVHAARHSMAAFRCQRSQGITLAEKGSAIGGMARTRPACPKRIDARHTTSQLPKYLYHTPKKPPAAGSSLRAVV